MGICIRCDLQGVAGIFHHRVKGTGERIQGADHIIAQGTVAVVHGDDDLWLDLLHQLFCLGGINGVKAANGNHDSIQAFQGLLLGVGRITAQVSQMGHPERVIVKDVDYVCSSQCSLLVIMEGVQGGDTEGAGLFWQKGDSLCVIVVAMVMAAQNLVGLLAENTVTGYVVVPVGIQKDPVAAGFQQKAGMSQPGDADGLVR